jgi:hypothetical protein
MVKSHLKNSSVSTNQSDFNLTQLDVLMNAKEAPSTVVSQCSQKTSLHIQAPKIELIKHQAKPQSFLTQLLVHENRTLFKDHTFDLETPKKQKKPSHIQQLTLDD